jgi:predicted nucleic acid-binding protein
MGQQDQTQATQQAQENQCVLNASVALLWFLIDEPPDLRLHAKWLLDDITMGRVVVHVPDLWLYEVSGGLVKAVHAKRLTLAQAQEALTRVAGLLTLPNWHLHAHEKGWRYDEVARWAMGGSLSFYDAVYLHLAQKRKASFWTADRRLYEFLRRTRKGLKVAFHWIGDYSPSQQN